MTSLISLIRQIRHDWKILLSFPLLMAVFPATGSIVAAVLLVCLLAIKSSKVYRKTLRAVRDYDGTVDRLGTPVLPGLLVMGNMSRMPSGLMVSLTVPVFGPRDQATVFAVAHRKGGDWHFTTLQLQYRDSSVHIDLLESVKSG